MSLKVGIRKEMCIKTIVLDSTCIIMKNSFTNVANIFFVRHLPSLLTLGGKWLKLLFLYLSSF